MLTENDMQDISRLIALLNKVIEYVVEKEGRDSLCKGILKSLRILESKQRNGFPNLYNYIMDDFRMMVDRGYYGEQRIDEITNEVCEIIDSNALFYK
ncbi:hypothetical protein V6M93_21350 [Pectobacterium brasiliense]|uniref:hypothetical protein n=1 Tax=Pectobacterium TaxID=122277 RepID=UPI00057D9E5A|nr:MULTISPECIES: hypothetical protein [Pectobacterium]KHS65813.1 hypothetical protein RC77_17380 [Pectobacterium brasiliense]KHS75532.1 hypothetical protein RC79_02700 [Pectobacterium brasiliense]KHS81753.1 hypothetical protein RC81_04065 [Pectobacterium brasiliense]KHS95702.1 hypothetical protein RC90_16240 [Pectobacterium brasiliense]KHT09060.1 hypothetical protein RC92_02645 [Pectobacterium brasiliense]